MLFALQKSLARVRDQKILVLEVKSWSTDLISANFVIFYNFLKSKVYCPCPRPANLNELQDNPSWETMLRRVMLDMKVRTVKCIAAGGGHFEK